MTSDAASVIWFEELGRGDVPRVGGKNASLGEMVANLAGKGVKVPPGFATTAETYWRFVDGNGLWERINTLKKPSNVFVWASARTYSSLP